MVFLSSQLLFRSSQFGRPGGGPDKFWRVQQFLRFAWKFRGRKQNCYGISMRYVYKSLMYSTIGRKVRKQEMKNLWNWRLDAAAYEHGISGPNFLEGLARCNIQLDRKVLTDLAIYEPRTFEALTNISKLKLEDDSK